MEARRPSGRRLRRCGDRKAWQSGVSKPLFCRSLESLRVLPLTRRLLPPLTTRPEVNSFDRFGSSDRWPEGGDRIECEGGRCRCFAGRATRPKGRFLVLPAFRHDHLADAPRPEAVDICSYDRVCMTRRWREMDSNFRFRVRCKPRLRPQAQREIPIGVHLIAGWPRWQLLSFQESDI